jgi:hypothetical protein
VSSGTALGGGIDCENSILSLTDRTVNANQANGTVLGRGGGIYSSNSVLTPLASTVIAVDRHGGVWFALAHGDDLLHAGWQPHDCFFPVITPAGKKRTKDARASRWQAEPGNEAPGR